MTDTQAQEAVMPVIAYLRASKDGMPQWTEDCVCEYPVYPSDPDGSDEDCISMPMVRKADADAVIVSQAARIAELERELARMREPLSDEWIRALCKEGWVFETVKQWVHVIEAAHGITKTGGGV